MNGTIGRVYTSTKRLAKRFLLKLSILPPPSPKPPPDWDAIARRIRACPEFGLIALHPLAGKVEGDRQYLFDGTMTVYPWSQTDDHHRMLETTQGVTEPEEILPFLDVVGHLPEDAAMIEAGAGWAYYSILFGARVPKGKLILIEGNPRMLELGRQNLELNGLADRAVVIHAAVSDKEGNTVRFSESDYGSEIREDGQYRVATVTLDSVIRRLNLSRVAIVHMDVQFFEHKVILGMSDALQRKIVDYVFIGTHNDALHRECEATLKSYGYVTVVSLFPGQTAHIDGVLVAAKPGLENVLSYDPAELRANGTISASVEA